MIQRGFGLIFRFAFAIKQEKKMYQKEMEIKKRDQRGPDPTRMHPSKQEKNHYAH